MATMEVTVCERSPIDSMHNFAAGSLPVRGQNSFQRSPFMRIYALVNSKFFALMQRMADFSVVVASFWIGYWCYMGGARSVSYKLTEFIGLGVFTGALFLVVFQSLRLYESKVSLLNVVETRRLLRSEERRVGKEGRSRG